jgi:predicted RND superfamily exporter protein
MRVFKWYGWYINVAQIILIVLSVGKYKISYIIIYIAPFMSIMSGLGDKVSQKPKATIAIILVLTLVFGYLGSSFVSEADPESFNPDHELIQASIDASDTFGTEEYNLLVIVKAQEKNILHMEDMVAMIEFEDSIRSDEVVGTAIMPSIGYQSYAAKSNHSCSNAGEPCPVK